MARPLLLAAVFSGLCASELRGLRWDDVDLKKHPHCMFYKPSNIARHVDIYRLFKRREPWAICDAALA
jgi:integrase